MSLGPGAGSIAGWPRVRCRRRARFRTSAWHSSEGTTRVTNCLDADDTRYAVEALKTIGFEVSGTFKEGVVIGPRRSMSANEVPLYVGKHKGSPSTRAKELLGLVGLSHRLNHRPNQLSGGEQQRVAIARALATDPAFVLADEPTGNLDAKNSENILKLIAYLREQTGKTFIIATHDQVVASHADRIIRLLDGKVASIESVQRGAE